MAAIQNVEAEAALLGALLQSSDLIDMAADGLSIDDFYEPVHGRIFEAIVREGALGKRVTPVTLKPYFNQDEALAQLGGVGYLARLTADGQGLLATRTLIEQVADLAKRRRMHVGLSVAAEACSDMTVTHGEIVSHADAAMNEGGKDAIHQPTGAECFDELLAGFNERGLGVTCGNIPVLDRLLGEMRPKQLVIGAGRPGMGKTALALSYALGAAQQGHGVLFVSLEMSSRELAARMAADLCFDEQKGVPYNFIRDGQLTEWQMNRVLDAQAYMVGLPFNVVDAGSLTTGRLNMLIRRHARRMKAKGQKLELVVIDYLQLLHPDKRHNKYEDVSEVSMALKAMAKDHSVAVFALAQLSRTVETRPDKRPILSDLRDSGQIEQDADAVLFLLRPEYYIRQEENPDPATLEHVKNKIEFILAKRRNGVTGNAVGNFHGAYQAVRG